MSDSNKSMESRGRSRSPLRHNESRPKSARASPAPSNASASSTNSNSSKISQKKTGKFQLKLSNVPIHWKWQTVTGYIKKICQVDKDIANDIGFVFLKPNQAHSFQDAFISFKNDYRKNQAFEQLKRTYEKVDGHKLYVTKISPGSASIEKPIFTASKGSHPTKFPNSKRMSQYYNDALVVEDNETYGLSVDYLRELNIKPPLIRKVFVRSLPDQYNDVEKARSLFGQAGLVVSLVILSKGGPINARIEYDHPVEAVQAISMFHDREIYGMKISCEMDSMKKIRIDGMPVQGPGLGPNGAPLRGTRLTLEVKKVKAEFMKEFKILSDSIDEIKVNVLNLLNASSTTKQMSTNIDNMPLINSSNPLLNATNPLLNASNPLLNLSNPLLNVANPLASNPLAALGNIISNQLPMQLLQSLVQQNSGNDMSVLGNALQNLTGANINSLLQKAQSNNQSGDSNMQGGYNMQVGSNMQGGPNMQGNLNMQGGPSNDMTAGSFNNIQRGPNNMQSGSSNMQTGLNNMQTGPSNMQTGPNNMQTGPNNMQTGPSNMPTGPNNMQSGSKNMQSGSNNMQSGPNNMQRGSNNMQTGHNITQRGPNIQSGYMNTQSGHSNEMANIQSGSNMQHANQNAFGSNSNTFAPPMQQGPSNIQGFHYNNMQLGSSTGPNQQMNTGFAGSPFNSNNTPNATGNSSAMLLFKNLPISVTLPALQAKMTEVGDVKFIQITGPGRALINFSSDKDADKCIALFNHSKVDGQIIEVKKM